MKTIKLLALQKLDHATDKTSCNTEKLIKAALVSLVSKEEVFADWIVNMPDTSFPIIVDQVVDLICDIDRQLLERSSYTYHKGLPEEELRIIVVNYHDYLASQM